MRVHAGAMASFARRTPDFVPSLTWIGVEGGKDVSWQKVKRHFTLDTPISRLTSDSDGEREGTSSLPIQGMVHKAHDSQAKKELVLLLLLLRRRQKAFTSERHEHQPLGSAQKRAS